MDRLGTQKATKTPELLSKAVKKEKRRVDYEPRPGRWNPGCRSGDPGVRPGQHGKATGSRTH